MPVKPKSKVGAQRLPISDLAIFHKNPRRGDVPAIMGSLRVNGQYRPIVVNLGSHTGRANEVLAGNHTLMAIRELAGEPGGAAWSHAECWVIDVDDDQCARIVAADNRTAELGDFDDAALLDLLDSIQGDIDGTGYEPDDLEALRDLLDGPPDLDDLADEHGDPRPDDFNKTIRLAVDPETLRAWLDHRKGFDSDTAALTALLNI